MLKSTCLALAAMLAATSSAAAFGALAIGGNTAEAATKGVAVGYATNHLTQAEAEADAVKQCLSFTGAPAETVAQCKLVRNFSHAWLVITMDPAAGTPGFGWSIDADKLTAERNALDQCRVSSPDDRKSYCEITLERGDYTP